MVVAGLILLVARFLKPVRLNWVAAAVAVAVAVLLPPPLVAFAGNWELCLIAAGSTVRRKQLPPTRETLGFLGGARCL